MNKIQWMMLGIYVGLLIIIYGLIGALVYMSLQPPKIVEKQVIVTSIVEKTIEVVKTVEVEKIVEVLVTQTPMPIIENEPYPVPTQVVPTPTPTEVPCIDDAVLLKSSPDQIDAGALKKGTIYRLYGEFLNNGTCIWDGYWMGNVDRDPFHYDMPVVYPGEMVRVLLDEGKVPTWEISYKLALFNNKGVPVYFSHGGWDGTLCWTMEPYWEGTNGYGQATVCGPKG